MYNYIDLGLLKITNMDLPLKLRRSTKISEAVTKGQEEIKAHFGSKFSQVFKTITGDNGLEFAELSTLEKDADTKVYFAHPYSSHDRDTNERHNGLIRKFIPKGVAISNFDIIYSC